MLENSFGKLAVVRAADTRDLGEQAAEHFAGAVARLLETKSSLNIVFSGAQSQGAFHEALRRRTDVPWPRLHAWAVDEFCAPGIPAHLRVCAQPERDLYAHVRPATVNLLRHDADPEAERERYEGLLRANPPDVACLGIGLSGHLALNEPGTTDFDDAQWVRHVEVCEASKRQLEQDPNFAALGTIPSTGLTITMPPLMAARVILVVVPYALKHPAIRQLWRSPVTPDFPASLLKRQAHATLFLDPESAGGL